MAVKAPPVTKDHPLRFVRRQQLEPGWSSIGDLGHRDHTGSRRSAPRPRTGRGRPSPPQVVTCSGKARRSAWVIIGSSSTTIPGARRPATEGSAASGYAVAPGAAAGGHAEHGASPGVLSTSILPPAAVTIGGESTAQPVPTPAALVVKNGVKRRRSTSAESRAGVVDLDRHPATSTARSRPAARSRRRARDRLGGIDDQVQKSCPRGGIRSPGPGAPAGSPGRATARCRISFEANAHAVVLLDIMKQLRLPGRERPVDVFEQGVADLAGHDFANMPPDQILGQGGRRKVVRDFAVQTDTVAAPGAASCRYRFDKRAVLPARCAQLVHGLVGAPLEALYESARPGRRSHRPIRNRQRFDCESPLRRCQRLSAFALSSDDDAWPPSGAGSSVFRAP